MDKTIQNHSQKKNQKIEKLNPTELQDLHEILRIADYILTKHETNKDFHSILKEFVGIINKSAASIESLDDEMSEMVISAESTISHIKTLQGKVSDDFDLESKQKTTKLEKIASESSGNNLTNSSIGVYTQEYQHNSPVEAEQVI